MDVVTLKMVPAIKVFPTTISIEELPKQTIAISGLDKVLQKIVVSMLMLNVLIERKFNATIK